MTREQLNNQPAKLIKVCDNKQTVVKEGTRSQCWNAKIQTLGHHTYNENYIVTLKNK